MAPKLTALRKVTEFTGEASGDNECFCFDKRDEQQRTADRKLDVTERIECEDAARIYPSKLLPDGCYDAQRYGVRGRFRVTVEFWPEVVTPEIAAKQPYPEVTSETLRWLRDAGLTLTMLRFLAIRHFLTVRLEEEPLDFSMDLNPHLQVIDVAKKVVKDVLAIGADLHVTCNVEDVLLLWVTDLIDDGKVGP